MAITARAAVPNAPVVLPTNATAMEHATMVRVAMEAAPAIRDLAALPATNVPRITLVPTAKNAQVALPIFVMAMELAKMV